MEKITEVKFPLILCVSNQQCVC